MQIHKTSVKTVIHLVNFATMLISIIVSVVPIISITIYVMIHALMVFLLIILRINVINVMQSALHVRVQIQMIALNVPMTNCLMLLLIVWINAKLGIIKT